MARPMAGKKRVRDVENVENHTEAAVTVIKPMMEALDYLTDTTAGSTTQVLNADLILCLAKALRKIAPASITSVQREQNRTHTHELIRKMQKRVESIEDRITIMFTDIDHLDHMRAIQPTACSDIHEQREWTVSFITRLQKLSDKVESISRAVTVQLGQGETLMKKKDAQKIASREEVMRTVDGITAAIRVGVPPRYLADHPSTAGGITLIMVGSAPTATTKTSPTKKQRSDDRDATTSITNMAVIVLKKLVSDVHALSGSGDPYYGEYETMMTCHQKMLQASEKMHSTKTSSMWEDLLGLDDAASDDLCALFKRDYSILINALDITTKPPWEMPYTVAQYLREMYPTSSIKALDMSSNTYTDINQPTVAWEFMTRSATAVGIPTHHFSHNLYPILFGKHTRGHNMAPALVEQIRADFADSAITIYTMVDMRLEETRAAVVAYLRMQELYADTGDFGDPALFPQEVRVQDLTPFHCLITSVHCTDATRVSPDHCLGSLLASRNGIVLSDDGQYIASGGAVNFCFGYDRDQSIFFSDPAWFERIATIASECKATTGFDTVSIRMFSNSHCSSAVVLGVLPLSWIEGSTCVAPGTRRLHEALDEKMALMREVFVDRWHSEDHFIFATPESLGEILQFDPEVTPCSILVQGNLPASETATVEAEEDTAAYMDSIYAFMRTGRVAFIPIVDTGYYRLTVDRPNGINVWFDPITNDQFVHLQSLIATDSIPNNPFIIKPPSSTEAYDERLLSHVPGIHRWIVPDTDATNEHNMIISARIVNYGFPQVRWMIRMHFTDSCALRASFDALQAAEVSYGHRNLTNIVWAASRKPFAVLIKDHVAVTGELSGGCMRHDMGVVDIIGVLRLLIRLVTHNPAALGLLPINFLTHCHWIRGRDCFLFDATSAWMTNDSGLTVAAAVALHSDIGTNAAYILRDICQHVRDVCAVTHPDAPFASTCINYGDMEFYRLFAGVSTTRGDDMTFLQSIVESESLLLVTHAEQARSVLWSTVMPQYAAAMSAVPHKNAQRKRTIAVPAEFVDGTVFWPKAEGLHRVHLLMGVLESIGAAAHTKNGKPPLATGTRFIVDYTSTYGDMDADIRVQFIGASSGIGVVRAVFTGMLAVVNYMLRELTGGRLVDPTTGSPWPSLQEGAFFASLLEAHMIGGIDTTLALDPIYFPRADDSVLQSAYSDTLINKALAGIIANNPCNDGRTDGAIVQAPLTDVYAYVDQESATVSTYYAEAAASANNQYRVTGGDWKFRQFDPEVEHLNAYICSEHMAVLKSIPTYLMHRLLCASTPPMTPERILDNLHFEYFSPKSHMPALFQEWIQSLSADILSRFCFFVTGARTALPGNRITIERTRSHGITADRLPMSTTCSRTLCLPDYYHILRKECPTKTKDDILAHLDAKMSASISMGALLLG